MSAAPHALKPSLFRSSATPPPSPPPAPTSDMQSLRAHLQRFFPSRRHSNDPPPTATSSSSPNPALPTAATTTTTTTTTSSSISPSASAICPDTALASASVSTSGASSFPTSSSSPSKPSPPGPPLATPRPRPASVPLPPPAPFTPLSDDLRMPDRPRPRPRSTGQPRRAASPLDPSALDDSEQSRSSILPRPLVDAANANVAFRKAKSFSSSSSSSDLTSPAPLPRDSDPNSQSSSPLAPPQPPSSSSSSSSSTVIQTAPSASDTRMSASGSALVSYLSSASPQSVSNQTSYQSTRNFVTTLPSRSATPVSSVSNESQPFSFSAQRVHHSIPTSFSPATTLASDPMQGNFQTTSSLDALDSNIPSLLVNLPVAHPLRSTDPLVSRPPHAPPSPSTDLSTTPSSSTNTVTSPPNSVQYTLPQLQINTLPTSAPLAAPSSLTSNSSAFSVAPLSSSMPLNPSSVTPSATATPPSLVLATSNVPPFPSTAPSSVSTTLLNLHLSAPPQGITFPTASASSPSLAHRARQHRRNATNQRIVRRARQIASSLLQPQSPAQSHAALTTLATFAFAHASDPLPSLERQEALDDAGAFDALLTLQANHLSHPGIQSLCASILSSLRLDDRTPLTRFDPGLAVHSLLHALRVHGGSSVGVVRDIIRALDALARLESVRTGVIARTGAIATLGHYMMSYPGDAIVQIHALRFLAHSAVRVMGNKIEMGMCGALRGGLLAARAQVRNRSVITSAVLAIRNVTAGGHLGTEHAMPVSEMVETSLDALLTHGQVGMIVNDALAGLMHLTNEGKDGIRCVLRHERWESALTDTAARHAGKGGVQTMALAVLGRAVSAGGPLAARRIIRVGGVKVALGAMHRFVNRRSVLFYGSRLVRGLLQVAGGGMDEVRESGGVERLLDLLYCTVVAPVTMEETCGGYADAV